MVATGLSGPGRAQCGQCAGLCAGGPVGEWAGPAPDWWPGDEERGRATTSRGDGGGLGYAGRFDRNFPQGFALAEAQATLRFALAQAPALEYFAPLGRPALAAQCQHLVACAGRRGLPGGAFMWCLGGGGGRLPTLLAELPGERWAEEAAAVFWRDCRNHSHAFFQTPADRNGCLWRLSVPQTAPVSGADFEQALIEWHGGLRWLWAPPQRADQIHQLARELGGHAKAWRVVNEATAGRGRLDTRQAALVGISRQLKASFDPHGLFNPGLTPHAN